MSSATMKRLSASIPDKLYERLEKMADFEGRSVSNLVAYLLEHSIEIKAAEYKKEQRSSNELRVDL
jgi:metal-responsive CopG/Arc/MetJ family transcriptional regulator